MGVRVTPKPFAAALLTIVLLLSSLAAPAAQARSGHRHGHGTRKANKHTARNGVRAAKHRRAAREHAAKQRAAHQAPAKPRHEAAVRKREQAEDEAVSAAQDSAKESEARIAQVLATPCQNTEVIPTSGNLAVVDAATLCLINKERAEHGVAPLVLNDDLEAAAQSHCAELIEDDYFAHVAPDGETPVQRIEKTGYIPGPEVGYVIGENLAWGTYQLSTPASIVAAWIASPGHLANILESRYTETGIAVTPSVPRSLGEGNPGATYAQEFGVIIH